jgi:hypothetical protein
MQIIPLAHWMRGLFISAAISVVIVKQLWVYTDLVSFLLGTLLCVGYAIPAWSGQINGTPWINKLLILSTLYWIGGLLYILFV